MDDLVATFSTDEVHTFEVVADPDQPLTYIETYGVRDLRKRLEMAHNKIEAQANLINKLQATINGSTERLERMIIENSEKITVIAEKTRALYVPNVEKVKPQYQKPAEQRMTAEELEEELERIPTQRKSRNRRRKGKPTRK